MRFSERSWKSLSHSWLTIGGLCGRVELVRVLDILLWHGLAYDDGKLNRVVCEGRDDEEIQRLDAMRLENANCGTTSTPYEPKPISKPRLMSSTEPWHYQSQTSETERDTTHHLQRIHRLGCYAKIEQASRNIRGP